MAQLSLSERLALAPPLRAAELVWVAEQLLRLCSYPQSQSAHISLSLCAHVRLVQPDASEFTLPFARCVLPPEAVRPLLALGLPPLEAHLPSLRVDQQAALAFAAGCILAEVVLARPLFSLQEAVRFAGDPEQREVQWEERWGDALSEAVRGLTRRRPEERLSVSAALERLTRGFSEEALRTLQECARPPCHDPLARKQVRHSTAQ